MKFIIMVFFILFCYEATPILSDTTQPVFKYPNKLSGELLDDLRNTPSSKTESRFTYVINLSHSQPDEIKSTLSTIYPSISIASDSRTRSLIIRTTPSLYRAILKTLHKIDTASRQIYVEVKIIETSSFNTEQRDSLLSSLGSGLQGIYDFENGRLQANDLPLSIQQLFSDGTSHILAKPTLTILDDQTATIRVGDEIPYVTTQITNDRLYSSVDYANTGIYLSLHPKLTQDNHMIIDIEASISNVKLWKEFGSSSYPILSTRRTQTKVSIEHGQTLVLAGLLDANNKTNQSGVPILSDLPIIGEAFNTNQKETLKSDIIFLIKPTIEKQKALE